MVQNAQSFSGSGVGLEEDGPTHEALFNGALLQTVLAIIYLENWKTVYEKSDIILVTQTLFQIFSDSHVDFRSFEN